MYGIFTYIWLIFMANVGKYTSPMDPMGRGFINQRFHHPPCALSSSKVVTLPNYAFWHLGPSSNRSGKKNHHTKHLLPSLKTNIAPRNGGWKMYFLLK